MRATNVTNWEASKECIETIYNTNRNTVIILLIQEMLSNSYSNCNKASYPKKTIISQGKIVTIV